MCTGAEILIGGAVVGAGLKVASDVIAGNAAEEEQRRLAEIDRQNALLAEEQEMLTRRRTQQKVQKVQEAGVRLMGKQETVLAGNNLDVSTGSAAEILEGTAGVVGEEVAVIRYNGIAEAYGYHAAGRQFSSQAAAHENAADDAEMAKWIQLGADLLAGGSRAAAAAFTPTPALPAAWNERTMGPPPPDWGG